MIGLLASGEAAASRRKLEWRRGVVSRHEFDIGHFDWLHADKLHRRRHFKMALDVDIDRAPTAGLTPALNRASSRVLDTRAIKFITIFAISPSISSMSNSRRARSPASCGGRHRARRSMPAGSRLSGDARHLCSMPRRSGIVSCRL